MARGRLQVHGQGRGGAPQGRRTDAQCVHLRQQFFFEGRRLGACGGASHLAQKGVLGEPRHLVEGGAHAQPDDERRAGVGRLLAHTVEYHASHAGGARAGGQHDHAGGVVGASALQQYVQDGAGTGHEFQLAEGGRVVASVGAVEQGVAHERHAQTAVRVSPGHRVVHAAEDVAGHRERLPDFQTHPHAAGVLADRYVVGHADAGVLQDAVEHAGLPALRRRFIACRFHGLSEIGPQRHGALANGVVNRLAYRLGVKAFGSQWLSGAPFVGHVFASRHFASGHRFGGLFVHGRLHPIVGPVWSKNFELLESPWEIFSDFPGN